MAFKGTKRRNRIQLEQDYTTEKSRWRAWFVATGDRKHGGAPECLHLARADGARPGGSRVPAGFVCERHDLQVYYAKCFKTDLRNGRGVGAKREGREREKLFGAGDHSKETQSIFCSSMPSAKNPKQSRPLHNISGGTGGPRVCECQATLMPGRKKEKRDIERERRASGHSSQAKEIFMNSVFRTGIVH